MEKMGGHSRAMLFPHCFIDEDRLKGAIGLFGSLAICLPWKMNLKADSGFEGASPFIKLLRPPEPLNPGPGFGRQLAEYREWIRTHQGRSVLAFLSALQDYDPSEEKSWEIRKRMRMEPGEAVTVHGDQPLKYHLVLHLAAEVEESHHTAESLIDVLKTSRSPLSGALDAEEDTPGLFGDLPSLKDQTLWQGYQWSQIVEAWFGLFHQHLTGEKILLTLDPRLIDFLKERFEKTLGEDSDSLFPDIVTTQLPRLPPTLPMDEISRTGQRFFRQEILDRLDSALKAVRGKRENGAGRALSDPLVRSLLRKVLVVLVN
jgi:hypothetical protein